MKRITPTKLEMILVFFGSKYALSFFHFMTHPLRNYELSKAGWYYLEFNLFHRTFIFIDGSKTLVC